MSGAEIPAIAAVASTAIGAGTALYGASQSAEAQGVQKQAQMMAAEEQAQAQEFEAKQLDLQGRRIRNVAAADEAGRREDLVSSLETIDAIRTGRGLDLDSPGGRAIARGVTGRAQDNIVTANTNYQFEAANRELAAELSRRKARYSRLAGEAGGAATDASIGATWASGFGRAAGFGLDYLKNSKGGFSGFGSYGYGGGASP